MNLEERLSGVRLLSTPVWVFDPERSRIVWTNPAAVELWRAASPEELFQRDFSDMSEAIRTRHEGILAALREGRAVQEEWTWYPRGAPVRVRCTMTGIALDDGRLAELCEAFVRDGVDPLDVRGVEALRHTSVMVALVTPAGEVLMQNPSTLRAFGDGAALGAWFAEAGVAGALLGAAEEGQIFRAEVPAETLSGQRWHAVEARPTLDPATGERAVLIQQIDVTERRERDAVIERQRREILGLSAPILEVGRRTLAVPIIGALDRERVAVISEKLLPRVAEQQAGAVILDLTGATAAAAADLLALVRALQLLGARPVVTGIRPALARDMVEAAAALEGVLLLRNLHQGIAACVGRAVRPGADATGAG